MLTETRNTGFLANSSLTDNRLWFFRFLFLSSTHLLLCLKVNNEEEVWLYSKSFRVKDASPWRWPQWWRDQTLGTEARDDPRGQDEELYVPSGILNACFNRRGIEEISKLWHLWHIISDIQFLPQPAPDIPLWREWLWQVCCPHCHRVRPRRQRQGRQ